MVERRGWFPLVAPLGQGWWCRGELPNIVLVYVSAYVPSFGIGFMYVVEQRANAWVLVKHTPEH